jgi:hypothetical protein
MRATTAAALLLVAAVLAAPACGIRLHQATHQQAPAAAVALGDPLTLDVVSPFKPPQGECNLDKSP